MLARFTANQLSRPGSILGPLVLGPLWNRRNAALNNAAYNQLALCPGDRLLEVGFGGGYLLRRMIAVVSNGLLAGVDVSPAMVAYVERRERRHIAQASLVLKCASATLLPFGDGLFTKVCSVNSIFYWQDQVRAFAELNRVTAPGGKLVLCFTDKWSLDRKAFARYGLELHDREEVEAMLRQEGFRDVQALAGSDRYRKFWCMTAIR